MKSSVLNPGIEKTGSVRRALADHIANEFLRCGRSAYPKREKELGSGFAVVSRGDLRQQRKLAVCLQGGPGEASGRDRLDGRKWQFVIAEGVVSVVWRKEMAKWPPIFIQKSNFV